MAVFSIGTTLDRLGSIGLIALSHLFLKPNSVPTYTTTACPVLRGIVHYFLRLFRNYFCLSLNPQFLSRFLDFWLQLQICLGDRILLRNFFDFFFYQVKLRGRFLLNDWIMGLLFSDVAGFLPPNQAVLGFQYRLWRTIDSLLRTVRTILQLVRDYL